MKKSITLAISLFSLFTIPIIQASEGVSATASSTKKKIHVHHNVELDESPYPRFVVDGVLGTKWESEPGDNQWILIDAGKEIEMKRFFITWEHNYPADYDILVSKDKKNWKKVYSKKGKKYFDNDDIYLKPPVIARYIKLNLIKERNKMGFGFAEITVNNEYLSDLTAEPVSEDSPYKNKKISPQKRAENLLSLMTFNEKMNMTGGVKRFYVTGLSRFKIPEVLESDASCGMNAAHKVNGKDTHWYTSFPATLALAATWNPELGVEYGKALGQECRSRGVGVLLGPGVNIQRISQCGRNFEYMGEDPHLAGQIAKGYVNGMQSQGTISTVKHLIANNQEFLRSLNDVRMSDRTLHEIYLPAFKTAAVDGEAGAIMTAYNGFRDSPCGSSKFLMNDLMRGQLGYKGFFMTDWSGYGPADKLLVSGQNIMMPSNGGLVGYIKREATTPEKKKELEKKLDAMLLPMLRTFFKYGLYDRPQKDPSFDKFFPAHKEVARKVGEEGITMLKNNGILPIDLRKSADKKAAAQVKTPPKLTLTSSHNQHELQNLTDQDQGNRWSSNTVMEPGMWLTIKFEKPQELKSLTFDSTGSDNDFPKQYELFISNDGKDWGKPVAAGKGATVTTIKDINKNAKFAKLVIVENNGGSWWSIHDMKVNGIPLSGDAKVAKGTILVLGDREVVTSNRGSSGDGSGFVGGYDHARFLPSLKQEFGKDNVVYKTKATDEEIKTADVILYFLYKRGCEAYTTKFEEPVKEHKEIAKVADLNPKTIVIYVTASGDALPWLDKVSGLLYCYYLGQERGNALAAVLSGRVNPSGKLPFTMEKKFSDSSAPDYNLINGKRYFNSHPKIPNIKYPYVNKYKDGIFIGYRWYDKKNIDVNFPFGYGLSYTTFKFSNLKAKTGGTGLEAKIQLSCKVKNTGKRAGAEVAQVYVEDLESSVERPIKELKAFKKVFLEPGEEKEIKLELDGQDLAFWSEKEKGWKVEPGKFRLHVGSSSRDLPLKAEFSVK